MLSTALGKEAKSVIQFQPTSSCNSTLKEVIVVLKNKNESYFVENHAVEFLLNQERSKASAYKNRDKSVQAFLKELTQVEVEDVLTQASLRNLTKIRIIMC